MYYTNTRIIERAVHVESFSPHLKSQEFVFLSTDFEDMRRAVERVARAAHRSATTTITSTTTTTTTRSFPSRWWCVDDAFASSSSSFVFGRRIFSFANSSSSSSSSSSRVERRKDVAMMATFCGGSGARRAVDAAAASVGWKKTVLLGESARIRATLTRHSRTTLRRAFFTRGEPRGTYDYAPHRSTRRNTSVVWGLIGTNIMVYLAWQEPENFRTMKTHFLVSESSLANGYWHTALTAAFSHNSFNHLFGNMFTLYFFGRDVALTCGGAYLLNLYLVGGVVASLAHVGYERYERRKHKPHVGFFDKREHDNFFSWFDERMDKIARLAAPASLGASGAVNAIIAMSVLMMPHRKIYLYGVLPLESWVFGAMFLLRDYAGLGTNDGVGHSAHLGGAATGALAFVLRNGMMR